MGKYLDEGFRGGGLPELMKIQFDTGQYPLTRVQSAADLLGQLSTAVNAEFTLEFDHLLARITQDGLYDEVLNWQRPERPNEDQAELIKHGPRDSYDADQYARVLLHIGDDKDLLEAFNQQYEEGVLPEWLQDELTVLVNWAAKGAWLYRLMMATAGTELSDWKGTD